MSLPASLERFADLTLIAERLSGAAGAIAVIFHALRRTPRMSDLPEAAAPAADTSSSPVAAAEAPAADAPIATAPVLDHDAIVAQAAPHIVQAVTSTPGVEPSHGFQIAANVISVLAQELPAILQITRANPRQSAAAGLSLGLFAAILQAFAPHQPQS